MADCICNQLSGDPPIAFEMRMAISALTARFSSNISDTVNRLTPKYSASAAWLIPSEGKISSRKIAPGCVGMREGLRLIILFIFHLIKQMDQRQFGKFQELDFNKDKA